MSMPSGLKTKVDFMRRTARHDQGVIAADGERNKGKQPRPRERGE